MNDMTPYTYTQVCVDGKISPDEDERLSALRRQYAISDQEHKDVIPIIDHTSY
jgi:hypothetical protein